MLNHSGLVTHFLLFLIYIVPSISATAIPRASAFQRRPTQGSLLPLKRIPRAGAGNLVAASDVLSTPLVDVAQSLIVVEVNFGGEDLELILDSGSSDTFVVTDDFTCLNISTHAVEPQESCMMGPGFNESAGIFQQIPDQNICNKYGGGEVIYGRLGYTNVTVGGLTVQNQEVGVIDRTAWNGDGTSSGVLGLAYSSLTSAYPGTNYSTDNATTNRMHYPAFIERFTRDYTQIQSSFAVAISRDESNNTYGGTLTFGGLPNLNDSSINATGPFVYAPLEVLKRSITKKNPNPGLQYYVVSGTSSYVSNSTQFLVDTGTTTIYIPDAAAAAYNAKFDPPTYGFEDYGVYFVNCTATPAPFSVTIAGQEFTINPLDLVVDAGFGLCASGVQSAGTISTQPSILGEVFLKNVVAEFDVGRSRMGFSAREFYES